MKCGPGTLCCGVSFQFDFTGIDLSTVRFYAYEGTRIIKVVYVKGGTLYSRISFDCGEHFKDPRELLKIKGDIKDIQILASEDKFVVALTESVEGQVLKRAISGKIDFEAENYEKKECPEYQPANKEQKIVNVALGYRKKEGHDDECETVDYVFVKEDSTISLICAGHG
jgi:hypothetical protein